MRSLRRCSREMRRSPETYHSILLQGEGEFFERNGLLYLPTADLTALVDRLATAQPLLGLLQARFDGAAVLDVATRTLTQAPSGAATDIEPFYGALAKSLDGAARGDAAPLAWRSLISAGAAPTNRRIVVLQPALNFGQMQPATTAINGIRDIVARLNAGTDAPVRVRLTGSVAMEHEELASVSSTAGIGGLATTVLVALILLAVLRSWRLLAMSLVTLAAGLALTARVRRGCRRPPESALGRLRGSERRPGKRLRDPRAAALQRARDRRSPHARGADRDGARHGRVARPVRSHDGGRLLLVHSDHVLGRVGARPDRGHRRVLRPVRQRHAAAGARRAVHGRACRHAAAALGRRETSSRRSRAVHGSCWASPRSCWWSPPCC